MRSWGGRSWYDSVQVRLQKSAGGALNYQTSYTFGKQLDTIIGNEGGENYGQSGQLHPLDIMYDKGVTDFGRRHSWTTNMVYNIPSPNWGAADYIFGGWRLGTIFSLKSGQPFNPSLSGNRSRSTGSSGDGTDRPDILPGRNNNNITKGVTAGCPGVAAGTKLGTPDLYFDPCAYSIQPVGFLGNSSRGHLTGPRQMNWDFSLTKQAALSALGEGGQLEFRAEFFNFLNHPSFLAPGGGATQVFTADGTTANTTARSTAGVLSRTSNTARQVQLGLKIIF